jgi:hypothetical protein
MSTLTLSEGVDLNGDVDVDSIVDVARGPSGGLRILVDGPRPIHSTITRSLAPRPNVSGMYISSAFGGGTTKRPGVVARAT